MILPRLLVGIGEAATGLGLAKPIQRAHQDRAPALAPRELATSACGGELGDHDWARDG